MWLPVPNTNTSDERDKSGTAPKKENEAPPERMYTTISLESSLLQKLCRFAVPQNLGPIHRPSLSKQACWTEATDNAEKERDQLGTAPKTDRNARKNA